VPRIEVQKRMRVPASLRRIGLRIGVHVGSELCVPYPTQNGCESKARGAIGPRLMNGGGQNADNVRVSIDARSVARHFAVIRGS
jgi:hypothetical protein